MASAKGGCWAGLSEICAALTTPKVWEGLLGPIREILKTKFHWLGDGLQNIFEGVLFAADRFTHLAHLLFKS